MKRNVAERYDEYNAQQVSESKISVYLACDTLAGISSDSAKYSVIKSLACTCTCSQETSICYNRRVQLDFCMTYAYSFIKIKIFSSITNVKPVEILTGSCERLSKS
jgi:hypothetical protein